MENINANTRRTTGKYHRPTQPQVFIEQGKLPPQALDMEAAVLGALMLEQDALHNAIGIVRADYFYKPENRIIFEAISDLFADSKSIDILTVTNKLREQGKLEEAGGAYYISQLTNRIASTANTETYARIVQQKYTEREIIRLCHIAIQDCYDETIDVFDTLDEIGNIFDKQLDSMCERQEVSALELAMQTYRSILAKRDNKEIGFYSGFQSIERNTSLLIPGELLIIAARPGMGKTAFALALAESVAKQKKSVLFNTIEMDGEELMKRMLSMQTGVSVNRMNMLTLHEQEYANLYEGVEIVAKLPMYFDDSPNVRLSHVRARAKKLHRQGKLDIIFVDYIQLMSGEGKNKEERYKELGKISRGLKALSKELKVPVVALAQLSREADKKGNKGPQISDLRESGNLEQDADKVILMWRPEEYSNEQVQTANGLISPEGVVCIDLAKNRNGPTFLTHLRFIKEQMKFTELENPFQQTYQQPVIDPNKQFEPNSDNTWDDSPF